MKQSQQILGLGALSVSVLLFELLLIRLFSIVLFSQLAFLGISLALFGLAFGGICVYIFPHFFSGEKIERRLTQCSFLTALSLIFFIVLFSLIPFGKDTSGYIFVFAFATIPFILSNICICLLLTQTKARISLFYAIDLCGAGIGVALAVALLEYTTAINAMWMAAVLSMLASLCFAWVNSRIRWIQMVLVLCLGATFVLNHQMNFLTLRFNKIGPETNLLFTAENAHSRITVEPSPVEIQTYSLSQKVVDPIPEHLRITIDSDASTDIIKFDGNTESVSFLKNDLSSAVYTLRTPGNALIIGPGGGRDILTALLFDYHVHGVEINPIIVHDIMEDRFAAYSGNIYTHPDVRITLAEGRSYLQRDQELYNVINLPLVDTWASTTAGSLFLTEGYLYTVEAFTDYLEHLTPDGLLSISRWEFDGPRLISLFFVASEALGIEQPEEHIIVLGNQTHKLLQTYIFSLTPFSPAEVEAIQEFAEQNGFSVEYLPGTTTTSSVSQLIVTTDKTAYGEHLGRNIFPVYDNNPFFFFVTSPKKIFQAQASVDGGLVLAFAIVTLLSVLILFLPTLYTTKLATHQRSDIVRFLSYFIGLGVGFMIIEMVTIQHLVLYLEQPIYSFSVVLCSFLLWAGIGSLWSGRWTVIRRHSMVLLALGILLYTLIQYTVLPPALLSTVRFPLWMKIIASFVYTAPLGIAMGTFLPAGLQSLREHGYTQLTAWCWAVNGAFSIWTSVAAIAASVFFGFSAVATVAGGIYVLVAFLLPLQKDQGS